MMKLTAADRAALTTYVRTLADALGLKDWKITIEKEPSDDDCDASIQGVYGRRIGMLWIHRDFRTFSSDRQRQTLIHELLHLHFEPMRHHVENLLEASTAVSPEMFDLVESVLSTGAEYGIDTLAEAIAPKYPPIRWPKKTPKTVKESS